MTITYDEALKEHMAKKGMTAIAVEVMSSQNSDFEITELYVATALTLSRKLNLA